MSHSTFADTSFFIALVDVNDESHRMAERIADRLQGELVTTTGVLLELGAFFSAPPARPAFATQFTLLLLAQRCLIRRLSIKEYKSELRIATRSSNSVVIVTVEILIVGSPTAKN